MQIQTTDQKAYLCATENIVWYYRSDSSLSRIEADFY